MRGEAKDDSWGKGFWVTFMVFSTLLPTFVHFVVALVGVLSIYMVPKWVRGKIAGILDGEPSALSPLKVWVKRL